MANESYDQSHLDSKYSIDRYKYNCPFCKRGHVSYSVKGRGQFNWDNNKECHLYIVQCDSCGKISLHLSWHKLGLYNEQFSASGVTAGDEEYNIDELDIDQLFFYHQPTSFFAVDKRVPHIIRELITEAEGCLRMNFLTGASACANTVPS